MEKITETKIGRIFIYALAGKEYTYENETGLVATILDCMSDLSLGPLRNYSQRIKYKIKLERSLERSPKKSRDLYSHSK